MGKPNKKFNVRNNRFDILSLDSSSIITSSANDDGCIEDQIQIAVNRIHGEFDIYQKSHHIIDIQVKASLCAAILRCIDLKNTMLPKNINPIILPLLRGCKTLQNTELQAFVGSSIVLLLGNVSKATVGKILNNVCLYISRLQHVENSNIGIDDLGKNIESIEKKGGISVLTEASRKYNGLGDPLFETIWTAIVKSVKTTSPSDSLKELFLLYSIIDIPGININQCIDIYPTFLNLLKYQCDGSNMKIAVKIIAKLACIENCYMYHKILMHLIQDTVKYSSYKLKVFHILFEISKLAIPSKIIPYMLLISPYIVHGISDFDKSLRLIAAKLFAWLVPYLAIEKSIENPGNFSIDMVNTRNKNSKLLSFLFVHERETEYHPYVKKILRRKDTRCDVDDKHNKNVHLRTIKYRPYQLHGISWMLHLRDLGLHGLLCDDMGLGKTIQALTVISARTNETDTGIKNGASKHLSSCPSLVICPSSVLVHWKNEINKYFANKLEFCGISHFITPHVLEWKVFKTN